MANNNNNNENAISERERFHTFCWTAEDVAHELKCSKRMVVKLVHLDRIPYAKADRLVRFCPARIKEWLGQGGNAVTAVGPKSQFEEAQLDKFHKSCAGNCQTKAAFQRHFEVDRGHVVWRAAEAASHLRWSLLEIERIAAVIATGQLNPVRSVTDKPIEIAVEGIFKEFEWTNPQHREGEALTGVDKDLCVRVVVRDTNPRKLIVTVYPDDSLDASQLPEVPYEFW
ncbi:unnamed protein product [Sphagnum balticum]